MIRIGTFIGEVPKVAPRYLPDTAAQIASNCRLDDGALTPIRHARLDATLADPALTIYRYNGAWLSWNKVVNVAPAPVAEDRLYYTGDGVPKMLADGTVYDLSLPRPATAPTVTPSGGPPDEDTSETVIYAYTFVTDFGEESEPSPLSSGTEWSSGMTNVLTGFDPAPPARVTRMRIYRSQTATSGATDLFFIHERAYSVSSFADPYGTYRLVEPIPSISYNPPPNTLKGLISLPNGMMAAFVGKKLYFCEPYQPHAWPEKYVLTTDYPIVGLGGFGSSMAVLTTGNPYVVTGTAPENMVMEKLELNLPCVSARGIVDLGYAVAYPSHEGLVTISNNGAVVVTEETIGRQRWQEMQPGGFVAGQYSGRYMASYAYQGPDGDEIRGLLIVDTGGRLPFIIRGADFADGMFYEITSGALYLLRNRTEIWEWDARSEPNGEMVWRSKPYILTGDTNFAFIQIEAEGVSTPAQQAALRSRIEEIRAQNRAMMDAGSIHGEQAGAVIGGMTFAGDSLIEAEDLGYEAVAATVYADGDAVATVYDINQPVRLPGGFLARKWEVEIRGNLQVQGITLGHAPSELSIG